MTKFRCRLCGLKHFDANHIPSRPGACQSHVDTLRSDKIYANHRIGEFCKEWKHCGKCCCIKHDIKVLKHFSGRCAGRKNNRCPVCFEQRTSGYDREAAYKIRLPKITRQLYGWMLLGKYIWRWQ